MAEGATEPTHCPGTPAEPKAEPGYLCIYANLSEDVAYLNTLTVTSGGAVSEYKGVAGSLDHAAYGSWAVTAPGA